MRLALLRLVLGTMLTATAANRSAIQAAPDEDAFSALPTLQQAMAGLTSEVEANRLDAAERLRELGTVGDPAAASALAGALDDKSPRVRYAALYALAGLGPDAQSAQPAVQRRIDQAQNQYERVLAAWTTTQIGLTGTAMAEVAPVLAEALAADDEAVAQQAAAALGAIGLAAEPHLRRMLEHSSSRCRALSAEMLGRIGARDAVGQIATRLTDDNAAVRVAVASALGAIGPASSPATDLLIKALAADRSAAVRARVADALGRIGKPSPTAIKALASAATDRHDVVARAAIQSLVRLGAGADVITALVPSLLKQQRPSVIVVAMAALADQDAAALPVLEKALQQDDTRFWALLVLSDLGPAAKQVVPQLAAMLPDAPPQTRRDILVTLAKIGPAAAATIAEIVPQLADPRLDIRYAATYAAGSIAVNTDKVQNAVAANLESDDPLLNMTSAWALAKISQDNPLTGLKAVHSLVAGLASDDPIMRQAAAQCLADLKPDPAKSLAILPTFVSTFSSGDRNFQESALDAVEAITADVDAGAVLSGALQNAPTRRMAALVVQRLGPKARGVAPALTTALSDPQPEVRRDVALAIAAVGPGAATATAALSKSLSDDAPEVRRAAAFALGKLGPQAQAAAGALRELLGGSDTGTRPVAAWALAHVAPRNAAAAEAALPILIAQLQSPYSDQRQATAEALALFGPAAAAGREGLSRAAADPSPAVRAAARKALKAVAP